MPLQRLEHYLVLSDDIHKTRDFYCDVLGMAEGFRPELEFPGFWLYLGDTPCIHIAEWRSYSAWTQKVGLPISTRAASWRRRWAEARVSLAANKKGTRLRPLFLSELDRPLRIDRSQPIWPSEVPIPVPRGLNPWL